MPLRGKRSRTMRARNLGLATIFALLAMLVPATAGVVLGHHATVVVAQISCNGNVAYTVNDCTSDNYNCQRWHHLERAGYRFVHEPRLELLRLVQRGAHGDLG
jgi:hypothetical protein